MAIDDLLDDEADDGSGEEDRAVAAEEGGEVGAGSQHDGSRYAAVAQHGTGHSCLCSSKGPRPVTYMRDEGLDDCILPPGLPHTVSTNMKCVYLMAWQQRAVADIRHVRQASEAAEAEPAGEVNEAPEAEEAEDGDEDSPEGSPEPSDAEDLLEDSSGAGDDVLPPRSLAIRGC